MSSLWQNNNRILTAPILSLTVSSTRGSWNQISVNNKHTTAFSTSLVGSKCRDLANWNVRIVRYLYWTKNPVGHFLVLISGCCDISSRSIKLAWMLPGSMVKNLKIKQSYNMYIQKSENYTSLIYTVMYTLQVVLTSEISHNNLTDFA